MPDSRKTIATKSRTSMFQPFWAMKSTTMLRETFSVAYSDEPKLSKLHLLTKISLILNKSELSLNFDLEASFRGSVSNCNSNSQYLISTILSTISHVKTIGNKSHAQICITLTYSAIQKINVPFYHLSFMVSTNKLKLRFEIQFESGTGNLQ